MVSKRTWGMLAGLVLGGAFGAVGGHTGTGIAVSMAAGAIAAGVRHYTDTRTPSGRP